MSCFANHSIYLLIYVCTCIFLKGKVRPEFNLLMNMPPSSINYQPKFADTFKFSSPQIEASARSACGQNTACLFDAAVTNDVDIGVQSRNVEQTNTQVKDELG